VSRLCHHVQVDHPVEPSLRWSPDVLQVIIVVDSKFVMREVQVILMQVHYPMCSWLLEIVLIVVDNLISSVLALVVFKPTLPVDHYALAGFHLFLQVLLNQVLVARGVQIYQSTRGARQIKLMGAILIAAILILALILNDTLDDRWVDTEGLRGGVSHTFPLGACPL